MDSSICSSMKKQRHQILDEIEHYLSLAQEIQGHQQGRLPSFIKQHGVKLRGIQMSDSK